MGNKKRVYYMFLFVLFGYNCNTKAIPDTTNIYYDIDLVTLNGVKRLKEPVYPFITIDSLKSDKKKVVFCYSNNLKDSLFFERKNMHWTTTYSYAIDTGKMTLVQTNYPDKIVYMRFIDSDSLNIALNSVSIFKNNKRVSYYFRSPINKLPTDVYDSLILKEATYNIVTDSFTIDKGLLKMFSTEQNFNYLDFKHDTSCYQIQDHSLFWWLSFEGAIVKNKSCP